MTFTADTWVLLSPVLVALGGAIGALVLDVAGRPRWAPGVGAVFLAVAAALGVALGTGYELNGLFSGGLLVGGWASYVSAGLLALGAVVLAGDAETLADRGQGPIAALMVFSTAMAVILATSRDVVFFIIALEAVAITGYAFVASSGHDRSDEAAMKYFVQGAVVTGLLLYGSAVLFGYFGGGTTYDVLRLTGVEVGGPALFAMIAFIAAVAFKMSAFPFHSWAPDALETAPAGPAAMLSSVPKAAMLIAATTLFVDVFADQAESWMLLFAILATASIAYGNFAALKQSSYQRMLGYSGIAQAGYALAGFVALDVGNFPVRLFAFTYALGAAGAFMAARAVRDRMPEWDGTIGGLSGLGSKHPVVAFSMAVSIFSLTGIPLTAGFWGKFWVFFAAVTSGWTWLAVVGFIGSVVSFGYYGAVLRAAFLDGAGEPNHAEEAPEGSGAPSGRALWASLVLAMASLAVGLMPILWGFDHFWTFVGF